MRLKILAVIAVTMMCSMTFAGLANLPETDVQGTPETCISRVNPATDGTSCVLSGNICNGISYFWEQGEAFNPTVSVSTWGTNTKGIAVDAPGTWIYNTAYGQCSADTGTIWDVWAPGENAVQVYEVFNDQSVSGRNYTCIFEDQMEGDGSTNFGVNNAQNALTVINDPYVISQDVNTCVIGIAPQTTGFEVASLFDGYAVYKSVTGPITQTNLGTYLGDASLDGGVWKYTDFAQTQDTWYTVKVKWNGGTYAFYAPLHSYGMSENLHVDYYWEFPPFVENLAAGPNPHNGNVASEYVTISATITDWDINIMSAVYRIDGGPWVMFPQTGVSPLPVSTLYFFPNGFSEGSHLLEAQAFNGYTYGSIESTTFSIVDTTAPIGVWNSAPGATAYVNMPMYFSAGYNDFRPYNPAVAASFFQYRVNNGTWTNVAWVNSSFAWGSYRNNLTYSIPGNTFSTGDWVDYRGQLKDTATTPNTAVLAQGSCQIVESPPHFDIPVISGWNLISFPQVASGSPTMVLDDCGGDTTWNVLKWYNPQTPMDPWKTYRVGGTANDLPDIDNTKGLWVYITNPGSDGMLSVAGDYFATTMIELKAGWNLVGYPTITNDTVANVFWGTGVDRVEVFDPVSPYIKAAGPTYVMHAGEGYWVHVNFDTLWLVETTVMLPQIVVKGDNPGTGYYDYIIFNNTAPTEGDSVRITSTIMNLGAVGAFTDVWFYLDAIAPGNLINPTPEIILVPSLGQQDASVVWTASPSGSHVVYVRAMVNATYHPPSFYDPDLSDNTNHTQITVFDP